MNECNFFLLSLNMNESENISDFETDNRFILSFYKKININVYEILNFIIFVWSSFIIVNRVWITLRVIIVKFMMYMILWLTKQKNNEERCNIIWENKQTL